jgi:hypothetical protein
MLNRSTLSCESLGEVIPCLSQEKIQSIAALF